MCQKVLIAKPYAITVVYLKSDTFVIVSTQSLPGILVLRANTKGVDPRSVEKLL